MKFSHFLVLGLFIAALFSTSCANQSEEDVRNQAVESVNVPAPSAPGAPAAATNASGVMHYTCPKNCVGSGGAAAGTCPVCVSEYVHNQAFHDTPGATDAAPTTITPTTTPGTPPTPEPAQNSAGVWHYTCGNGCAGGAGAAGTCPKCGGALAHNAAYHN